jgi:iron complex outermembrane receptor protein
MPYVDAGTTFNQDRTVYGRLVALYRSEGSFIDFNPGVRRLYVAPSITWDISAQTQLTVLAAVSRERNELIPDQPAYGFILPNPNGRFRRDLYIGNPSDPGRIRQDWDTFGYELRHTLTDQVSLYQNARASYLDLKYINLYQPLALLADQRTELQYGEDYGERRRHYSVDTGVNATFDTSIVQHRLNAGVEYEGTNDDNAGELGFAPTIGLDLYNPDYSVFVKQPRTTPFGAATLSNTFGFYVQDELQPMDRLAFTIGGRYDVVRINGVTDHAFVPRVGTNYTLLPGVVAYVSYAKSFNAQPGLVNTQGAQLQPEKGTQYEAGVKVASADGRISSTVSIFQLTRTNVANQVPGGFSYQATGEQRSRGIELDGQFKLAAGWEMLASYSYLDAVVKADTVIPVGNLIPSTPKHKASLWMRYVLQTGPLSGLGFSAGGSAYSRQAGDDANSFFIPAYPLVNANLSYRRGPYSVLFNVNNVLDRDYVRGALGTLFTVRGDPRNYRLTVGYSF